MVDCESLLLNRRLYKEILPLPQGQKCLQSVLVLKSNVVFGSLAHVNNILMYCDGIRYGGLDRVW